MYFDVQKGIELLGEEYVNTALNSTKASNFTFDSFTEGEENKISFCLKNFYKNNTEKRRKRSFLAQGHDDQESSNEELEFSRRNLLSLENPTFGDIENEVLSNDVVSKALGSDVCRYCVSKCPEN